MRSTQQLLATRFKPEPGTNQQRLKALERKREKTITAPEKYHDMHSGELMDNPCNIKLKKSAEDYYIEYNAIFRLPIHPLSRENNWVTDSHAPDRDLAERIATMITIEEIKEYLLDLETRRQADVLNFLEGKSDQEVSALLAFDVEDFINAHRLNKNTIPEKFHSMLPGRKIMTVPVRLDNTYVIDFHELLMHQPHHLPSKEEEEAIQKRYESYIDRRRYDIENERKQFLNLLNHNISTASLSPDNATDALIKCDQQYQEKLVQLENFTLERYIAVFEDREQPEYINPITGKPLQSIQIDYQLIQEIDDFIDPFNQQMQTFRNNLAKYKYDDNKTCYADILKDKKYPAHKIPESIAVGQIPGSQEMEIMTHPVILDGVYAIDYARLKKYWESTSSFLGFFFGESRYGLNPFTGKAITSIVYDTRLKTATSRFMANLDNYSEILTNKEITDSNFLRYNYSLLFTKNNWLRGCTAAQAISIPAESVSQNH